MKVGKEHFKKTDGAERERFKNWFDEKKQELVLAGILETKYQELLNFQFNGRIMEKENIVSYTKYLKCVNEIIEMRGEKLAKKLK